MEGEYTRIVTVFKKSNEHESERNASENEEETRIVKVTEESEAEMKPDEEVLSEGLIKQFYGLNLSISDNDEEDCHTPSEHKSSEGQPRMTVKQQASEGEVTMTTGKKTKYDQGEPPHRTLSRGC